MEDVTLNYRPIWSLELKLSLHIHYCKIPKISPGAYIFQRPFLRGLYSEGLMYEGKFAFQNRLGWLVVARKFTIFALFYFVFQGKFQVQATGGGGGGGGGELIFGGAI